MEPITHDPAAKSKRRWQGTAWIASGILLGVFAGVLAQPADVAVAVLSAALVVTTAFYAVRTSQTVEEMRLSRSDLIRAREEDIRPRLRPVILPGITEFDDLRVGITNAGRGHAFDVDVEVCVEPPRRTFPIDSSKGHSHQNPGPRKWKWGFVENGSTWLVKDPIITPGGTSPRVRDFDKHWEHLWLGGTCRDGAGRLVEIDERVELGKADHHRYFVHPYQPPNREGQ